MLRAVAVAIVMLLAFCVVWLIAVPTFDIFIVSIRPYLRGGAVEVVENVRIYVGNTFVWVGILFVAMVIVWLLVYAFRREVDTYAEYR